MMMGAREQMKCLIFQTNDFENHSARDDDDPYVSCGYIQAVLLSSECVVYYRDGACLQYCILVPTRQW